MDDYSRPTTTHKTPHPNIGFLYIIPLGITIGFLVFTVGFFMKQQGKTLPALMTFSDETEEPTPELTQESTGTEEAEDTPTPTESIASVPKDELSIMVLNGSGVAGAAGKVAEVLKKAGYTTVKTGNAQEYDFTNLTIRYRTSARGSVPELEKDLNADYTVSETEEASLSGSLDVEIIVGKTPPPDES